MRRLPAELRHPLFLLGAATYGGLALYRHAGARSVHWPPLPELVRHHLTDLLTLPLLLTLALWALRRLYFRQPAFVLPASWIFSAWLVVAVWFEGLLPRFDARATADWLDVGAYALGGLLFWRWLNRPART
ncbi:hypothetical protein [Hymenobacter rubripertinctus]|uniref:Magnesium citrate secondary transporter n=1 Tax=Hymenobacter rubripertinctus TaxID=2029981 RepID=A0A418R7Q3_9BACT|nr:hypothetical protein [Hymenobacter rubripertinctus]RIY13419.1 hypothetical protein D0T11_02995 [Hymenobacter rubripertinctus]